MLGIQLIDRADLEALSAMAESEGRYEFMLTTAPLLFLMELVRL